MSMINGFRIWNKETKRMYYKGFFIDHSGNLYKMIGNTLLPCKTDNYIVMKQLTGHKDISNMVVYEKDILRYQSGKEFIIEYGTHDTLHPDDHTICTTEGFVAIVYSLTRPPDFDDIYPLMDIEHTALCVGNIYEGYYKEYVSD